MKKMIALFAMVLTLAGTLPAQEQAPANNNQQNQTTYYPVPSNADAPAPVYGTNYGADLVYLGIGAAVVAGAAALIITSSHGTSQGHAHVHS